MTHFTASGAIPSRRNPRQAAAKPKPAKAATQNSSKCTNFTGARSVAPNGKA